MINWKTFKEEMDLSREVVLLDPSGMVWSLEEAHNISKWQKIEDKWSWEYIDQLQSKVVESDCKNPNCHAKGTDKVCIGGILYKKKTKA